MKPLEYLTYQFELEGIRRVGDGLIARIDLNATDFPLLLYAKLPNGQNLVFLDELLPLSLRDLLQKNDRAAFEAGPAIKELSASGINAVQKHFRTYAFPQTFLSSQHGNVKCFAQDDPKVEAFGFGGLARKVFGFERNGSIFSACVSSRQNSSAAEAWVFTDPQLRGKGYAQLVTSAWAADLLRQGITPFYSHALDNMPSAKLAAKLGLIHIFDETVIERTDQWGS